jgi:4-hydroxybenzoate polyprenyltransferase
VRKAESQWDLRTGRIASLLLCVVTLAWVFLAANRPIAWIWFPVEAVLVIWILRHSWDALTKNRANAQQAKLDKSMKRSGFGPFRD